MGRMVTVEEWAEIHGKTPATVRRKIHTNAWPNAKQATLDGKLVWMLDEDWLWPRAMTKAGKAAVRDPPPDASRGLHYRRGWHSDLHGALHPPHTHCHQRDG